MICFVAWCWLSMSGMDYYEGAPYFGYKTAGWFLLGMPFLLGFGLVITAILAFISRRTRTFIGWTITALAYGFLISQSVISSLPNNRLASLLNLEPNDLRIIRLKQMDSHSDGITTVALIDGDDILFDKICRANDMVHSSEFTPTFFNWLHDGEPRFVEPVAMFDNDRLTCYNDTVDRRIYVYHRSRSHPGEE